MSTAEESEREEREVRGTGETGQAATARQGAVEAGTGDGRRPLAGSVALVTGASSGIGAATALALAREGCSLVLVARRTGRLEELAEAIGAQGGASLALTADLAAADEVRRTVDQTVDHFGRLDVLVNNAGFGARGAVADSDPADWDRMVDLNFKAVLRMSHAALPHLLRAAHEGPRGVADLVTVSSVAGRVPRKDNSVYSATKHAVCSFSEALRQEVTGRQVRVGLVEPGMTTTEMTRGGSQAASAHGLPPESWLRAEDIARSVVFMVTQPPHVAVNEITVRPTAQER
ncbi:SDR family oxidoreductase [Streptomyces nigrescens]|uniref:Oxidoreductase n=1 Tax=Streptomyces nigrescens TaxID=1920 RepID=A0A640TEA0_STRNI|nr:SDR family NAD(P)-dependent oxidoreductase [Streptomyces libani]WAT94830.1 SDR family NAD(P)-dependent oxidoreductase [Streptomyces libani subsp. libani]GFE19975.1 oxidoreductase [Streptomyces libani subsp. libani]GGV85413.1 oxidoreductase [Streptomyces libani subsp. libani]